MRAIIPLTLSALIIFFAANNADAVPVTKYNMITITLSETCVKMNQNHITGCPTIKDLRGFDNSNQAISGKFVEKNNETIRTNPQLKNHYVWYQDYKLPVVCVDCNADFINPDLVQNIIIEPHDFVWAENDAIQKTRVFTQQHGRFMAGCNTSNLAYDWNLMTDTIYYMRNNCASSATDYNSTSTYVLPSTPFDMTAQPLKNQAYYKAAKSCTTLNSCANIETGKKW